MKEYEMIKDFYGDGVAKRSGVPLMNHIDEGIEILTKLGSDTDTIAAFCLHPLLQGDKEFEENLLWITKEVNPYVLALVLEYRSKANIYLCKPHTSDWDQVDISIHVGKLIEPVRQMLIADKIQNRKDFEIYHKDSHPNAVNLTRYFNNWIKYLGVEE